MTNSLFDMAGKVAVITGGASGVGRSLAFALGRRGAKIAIGDVDGSAMEQVGQDLASENIEAIVEHCPVPEVDPIDALKALIAPFGQCKFCPTGGIRADDFRDYLPLPNVACVDGSWGAPRDRVAAGDVLLGLDATLAELAVEAAAAATELAREELADARRWMEEPPG